MSNDHELLISVLSDSTGDTGQVMIRAVLSQFKGCQYRVEKFSFVDTKEELLFFLDKIEKSKSILAYTVILPEIKALLDEEIKRRQIKAIDLLGHTYSFFYNTLGFCPVMEKIPSTTLDDDYFSRVEAMDYTVRCDDGQDLSVIDEADVILLGISRTSKTPLSMYLAYQGYRVVNLPLVPEVEPPEELFLIPKERVVGLVLEPEAMQVIRVQRLKSMRMDLEASYASIDRIHEELDYAKSVMEKIGCRIIDVTQRSIEETAVEIINAIK